MPPSANSSRDFPQSHYAPGAMLRIGRIYEEDHKYDLGARASMEDSLRATLRAIPPTTRAFACRGAIYMTRRYAEAAKQFRRDARASGNRGRLA